MRTLFASAGLFAASCGPSAPSGVGSADVVVTPEDSADPSTPETGTVPDTADSATPRVPVGVVLFVGDGMGPEHVKGAGLLATGDPEGLSLLSAPIQGTVRTASLSGFTDSAAAATTLATGVRTHNGRLGVDKDGAALETIFDLARARGLATGVVTTDVLSGATPAAFLVHEESRYAVAAIAAGLVANLPDVLFGGGKDLLLPMLPDEAKVVTTAAELAADPRTSGPLVGLFARGSLPFVIEDRAEAPDLPTQVLAALDVLEQDPEGFVLVVEAARIDHASHANRTDAVFHEAVELADAVDAVVSRAAGWTDRDLTLVVTADHECGGLQVLDEPPAGVVPTAAWRWYDHTNTRVGAYAWGDAALPLQGQDRDHRWIHAVLASAISGDDLIAPAEDRVADGVLSDLGAPVAVQVWDSDRNPGRGQLDALRLAADPSGLWVGIDGVYDDHEDVVLAWMDLDVGAGTGMGADLTVLDVFGSVDTVVNVLQPTSLPPGFGLDAVVGVFDATQLRLSSLSDRAGLRLLTPPSGQPDDLWWMPTVVNPSFARVAQSEGVLGIPTGDTSGEGLELFVPWTALFPEGLPSAGTEIGVAVTLSSVDGTTVSNQALPPWPSASGPEAAPLPFEAFAVLAVSGSGEALGSPSVRP